MDEITSPLLERIYGLTVKADFVPFSKSRHAKENPTINDLSLNWKVTLFHNNVEVVSEDYQAGIEHSPSYKKKHQSNFTSISEFEAILQECELGKFYTTTSGWTPILPETADVINSLLMDSEAIDSTYEDWADCMGYNEDSRKGEAIYRQCLEIGLKMRSALGDAKLSELRELFSDY